MGGAFHISSLQRGSGHGDRFIERQVGSEIPLRRMSEQPVSRVCFLVLPGFVTRTGLLVVVDMREWSLVFEFRHIINRRGA